MHPIDIYDLVGITHINLCPDITTSADNKFPHFALCWLGGRPKIFNKRSCCCLTPRARSASALTPRNNLLPVCWSLLLNLQQCMARLHVSPVSIYNHTKWHFITLPSCINCHLNCAKGGAMPRVHGCIRSFNWKCSFWWTWISRISFVSIHVK